MRMKNPACTLKAVLAVRRCRRPLHGRAFDGPGLFENTQEQLSACL